MKTPRKISPLFRQLRYAIAEKVSSLAWRFAQLCLHGNGMSWPFQLIHMFRDDLADGTVSLGAQFIWKGRLCRVAVKMNAAPSADELERAWLMLSAAVNDPENPQHRAAFDEDLLSGREMDARLP